MNAIVPKGWCPGLYDPMASGDGLLVRIKPYGAVLTANAARQLGVAASRFGNGVIELTSRAAIQVRGLSVEGTTPFAAAMVAAGLADADPDVERRRSVIVPPLADETTRAVATAVEQSLTRDPRLTALPPKFAVSVDGNGVLPAGDIGADIQVACKDAACSVTLVGTGRSVTVAAADVPETVVCFALAFLAGGTRRLPAPRAPKAIGWLPHGQGGYGAFGLGLPFGATTAATLVTMADLSERTGDGTLRVTPWRAFVIPCVSADMCTRLRNAGNALGLIVDPADARLAVITCPGQPSCASATVATRADAMQLVGLGLPPTVHISGCAKGCAHPAAARITLVGENRLYGVVRDGRASDAPSERNLTLEQVITVLLA